MQEIERQTPVELMPSLPKGRVRAQVQEFSRWASTSAGRSCSPQHSEERAAMDAEFVTIADEWLKDLEWSGTWSNWKKGEQDTIICPDDEWCDKKGMVGRIPERGENEGSQGRGAE